MKFDDDEQRREYAEGLARLSPGSSVEEWLRYVSYTEEAHALDPFLLAIDPDEIGGAWPRVSAMCPRCGARIVQVRAYRRGSDYTIAPLNSARDISPGGPMSFADPAEGAVWFDLYERRPTREPLQAPDDFAGASLLETSDLREPPDDLPISWTSSRRVALTCQRAKCGWSGPFRQTTLLMRYLAAIQIGDLRFIPTSSDTPHGAPGN